MVQSLTRQEPRVSSQISSLPGAGRSKRAGAPFHSAAPDSVAREPRQHRSTRTALQPERQDSRLQRCAASSAREENPKKPNQHCSYQALLVSAHGGGIWSTCCHLFS